MKSITEISQEIGVTPQAIYKKINKPQFKQYVKKDKRNKTVITTDGVELLKQSFSYLNQTVEMVEGVEENSLRESDKSLLNEQLEHFKRTVESVERQLSVKDDQIKELLEQNKQLIKQNENSQSIIFSMQQQNALMIEKKETKRSILDYFKSKKADY